MISHINISVIIPTRQAACCLPALLDRLNSQRYTPLECIIVDTASTDGTVEIAQSRACRVMHISPDQFRHGKARNLGASAAHGDNLVFLTQDALPVKDTFLEEITRLIRSGQAVAVTARQIPYPTANPIEAFTRQVNYPAQSNIRTSRDIPKMGIRTFFFSNSSAAVSKSHFMEVGGFNEDLIVNEDMELCARLIQRGYAVAYSSEAQVFHSHNYSLAQLWKRYFDIGVYFTQANPAVFQSPLNSEGKQLAYEVAVHLVQQRAYGWLLCLALETGVKLLAFRTGLLSRWLPVMACRRMSAQPNYWNGISRSLRSRELLPPIKRDKNSA